MARQTSWNDLLKTLLTRRQFDGPTIIACQGCSGQSHPFLAAEGVYSCKVCEHSLCRFCHMNEELEDGLDGNGDLCCDCVRDLMSGVLAGEDEDKMRAYLREKGQDVPATATYLEVLSQYETVQEADFDFFEKDVGKVKYPILPTSALEPSRGIIERIKAVTVETIGAIMNDNEVGMDAIARIIHIFIGVSNRGRRAKQRREANIQACVAEQCH
mmetsp:Transcript_4883/g.10338  ORF Transcript_4883/g.10338 Transcript_4883/m.10338 type:complete len:214 (-) Transcript_4883:416-1057(-)